MGPSSRLTGKALPCRACRNAERACGWAARRAASGLAASSSPGGELAVESPAEVVQNSSRPGSGRGSGTECTMCGPCGGMGNLMAESEKQPGHCMRNGAQLQRSSLRPSLVCERAQVYALGPSPPQCPPMPGFSLGTYVQDLIDEFHIR